MTGEAEQQLRAYVEYLRDLGVYNLYRRGDPVFEKAEQEQPVATASAAAHASEQVTVAPVQAPVLTASSMRTIPQPAQPTPATPLTLRASSEPEIPKLISFNDLAPLPEVRHEPAAKSAALEAIREEIGDCTRCPLAYAGRHKIVFADGDPNARLMFVGEGPGADEDAQGLPFVGKAGQLLNNMITAMGLKREQVYIANIVKCRPPANRVPEPVEANTCSQFLLRQIDVVQPQIIVALGSTAATYLLGRKQSLAGLRGIWHSCRGAKLAVTYHPAFLLRDPRQKGEAWKDLQMVMKEMGLKAPGKG
ncbi:uracil-DNA glycosylase family protein [Edaphobacter sp. 12200R-103]|jgi:DNA polymerase|uniref:uracil-DNA glycosylase n=1 Tax=Edaphobacter sp. 12200R-103 TaxID=2703788 RepID=UPI00138D9FF8|nr:uracil-DNA glycosylase [Edaphobacter sp. 12200R-103]QHS50639.1 uracil-DNA glycosylase [Edaphobacter sp. 12200R-103]